MKRFILCALCACSLFAGYGKTSAKVVKNNADTISLVFKGDAVPDFEVFDRNNRKVTPKDLKGSYTLLVFFATWCPYCRYELPEVQQLQSRYGSRPDFKVLPISRDEHPDTVAAFFRNNGYNLPIVIDVEGKALAKFAKRGIPRSFLLDKQGVVLESTVGYYQDSTGESNFAVVRKRLESVFK